MFDVFIVTYNLKLNFYKIVRDVVQREIR